MRTDSLIILRVQKVHTSGIRGVNNGNICTASRLLQNRRTDALFILLMRKGPYELNSRVKLSYHLLHNAVFLQKDARRLDRRRVNLLN